MVASTRLYEALGVSPSASQDEIRRAYRQAALRWHPDRNLAPEKKREAESKFKEAATAYEVLSDPKRRAAYDELGDAALQGGASGRSGVRFGSSGGEFVFTDPRQLFETVFGPGGIEQLFRGAGGVGGLGALFGAAAGRSQRGATTAKSPQLVPLRCTLEQLHSGAKRKLRVRRRREGGVTAHTLEVTVQPGWRAGTRVTFRGEGDHGADLVFVVSEAPHALFTRQGADLVTVVRPTKGRLRLATLDGRRLALPLGQRKPGEVLIVPNAGMPIRKGGKVAGSGDLRVVVAPEGAEQIQRAAPTPQRPKL